MTTTMIKPTNMKKKNLKCSCFEIPSYLLTTALRSQRNMTSDDTCLWCQNQ